MSNQSSKFATDPIGISNADANNHAKGVDDYAPIRLTRPKITCLTKNKLEIK